MYKPLNCYQITYVACPQDYTGGILWNRHRINDVARIRCSTLYSSFRPGVYITRMCNSNGEWSAVDYSSCTMRLEALPLIMVEIINLDNLTDATSIVNKVCICIVYNNYIYTYVYIPTSS